MTTIALYINRKSNVLTVVTTIAALTARKDSTLLFSVKAERAPREHQKVLNTVHSFAKQFAKVGVTLDVSNVHRANLSEKGINRKAASKLAQHLHGYNTRALLASAKVLVKYGF